MSGTLKLKPRAERQPTAWIAINDEDVTIGHVQGAGQVSDRAWSAYDLDGRLLANPIHGSPAAAIVYFSPRLAKALGCNRLS